MGRTQTVGNEGGGNGVAVPTTFESQPEDRGTSLIEFRYETWSSGDPEERRGYLVEIDRQYHEYLTEFYNSSNLCAERFEQFHNRHNQWRRGLIMSTGGLAIVNLLAAHEGIGRYVTSSWNWLALAAAVYAALLSVLANLESYQNCQDRAQAYRESRDLFLDSARDFSRLWEYYVRPFGDRPEACVNASELYRRIVGKDRELRAKFKDLTKADKKGSPRQV